MEKNISLQEVKKLLERVKHPSIDATLLDLGIIKKIELKGAGVGIILALPFENIPIKEQLIELIKKPLAKLGTEVTIEETIMNQEELQKFLAKEQENWKY